MADDARTANLTGVVALGIATELTAAVEAATGLSVTEVAALTTLANWADGRSIERLREVTALSQPGCARMVDRLAGAGLARRAVDPDDRRVTTVHLTAAGRQAVRRAHRARLDVVARWVAGLSDTQRVQWAGIAETLAGGRVDDGPAANRLCRLCDTSVCGEGDACPVTRAVPPVRRDTA